MDIWEKIAALPPEQRTLFRRRLLEHGNEFNVFPLSFAQQRLWFLDQLTPGLPVYNIAAAIRLVGPLRRAALRQSLKEVVNRQAMLRARILPIDGEVRQAMLPTLPPPVVFGHTFDTGSLADREAHVQAYLDREAHRPFDLIREPLIRMHLLTVTDLDHVLLVVTHHLVSDGWSMVIFLRELRALYTAHLSRQPVQLPTLPIQYTDFVTWQRQQFSDNSGNPSLRYWQEKLQGTLSVLALPASSPRPPAYSGRGATCTFALPPQLSEAVEVFSRREKATLFMTLLAVFQLLLHHATGQEDILVSSPVSGRSRPETEGIIGLFVNLVTFRTAINAQASFREFLRQVKSEAIETYAHQEYPFERVVQAVRPERTVTHSPLFQTMFVFRAVPEEVLQFPDVSVRPISLATRTAKCDLTWSVEKIGRQLTGAVEYSTDVFTADVIRRMIGHFQTLLTRVIADPQCRLSALSLLSEAEHRQIVTEWNTTHATFPEADIVPYWIEAQAASSPHVRAVVCQDTAMSYEELNAQANQLAWYLKGIGVGPETVVGICLERSLAMVVGLLGVLKAGGAYLPLDPAYPAERLSLLVTEAQADVLLTESALQTRVSPDAARVIRIDADWPAISRESRENPERVLNPEHLAYVIYTSGSTGKPKGVEIPHRALTNLLAAMRRQVKMRKDDVLVAVTSLSFDIASLELWLPLVIGGTLVVAPAEDVRDGGRLQALIARCGATLMQATPATWQLLLAAGWQGDQRLRLLCGGETLSTELAKQLCERSACLWNVYGPTETTIWSAIQPVSPDMNHIPLGRPLANTQIYILDKNQQPVPIGVLGEIYIGGAGVARGYRHRPDLTAQRFLPDPFATSTEAYFYRTGDVGCYRPDGTIEFHGRVDNQVKIRGHRVEPGEVEAVLRQYEAVHDAVVIATKRSEQDSQLVAYVVAEKGEQLAHHRLRDFLKTKLPAHLIPSQFMVLETLPVSPNGKIDRRALPAPGQQERKEDSQFVHPRSPMESRVAKIWGDVLEVGRMSVHDDFFDLGGHSLQAMQVVAQLSTLLGVEIPIRFLLLHPTVARLAEAVAPLLQTDGRNGDSPLSLPETPAVVSIVAAEAVARTAETVFRRFTDAPLLPRLLSGDLGAVDAAAIASLPDEILAHGQIAPQTVIQQWCGNRPVVTGVYETALGSVALIVLPCFTSQLYTDGEGVKRYVGQALDLAQRIGARVVSFTGLLGSATAYGQAVQSTAAKPQYPRITTGHATTVSAVVLAIKKILAEGGRDIAAERVGLLGLGSIGTASLRLLLTCLPHPQEIILCDIYGKRNMLNAARQEVEALGFQGALRIIESRGAVPEAFYHASLMLGATNAANVLEVNRVRPGTLIVDDSAPHCFAPSHAVQRFHNSQDILFTEGGVLRAPQIISRLFFVPHEAGEVLTRVSFDSNGSTEIMGCIFSSLLSARFPDAPCTVGIPDLDSCRCHYERVSTLGMEAPDLHCADYVLPAVHVRSFKNQFGTARADFTAPLPPERLFDAC